jgi:hypothetical protein
MSFCFCVYRLFEGQKQETKHDNEDEEYLRDGKLVVFLAEMDENRIDDFSQLCLANDYYLFMMVMCLKFYPLVSLLYKSVFQVFGWCGLKPYFIFLVSFSKKSGAG